MSELSVGRACGVSLKRFSVVYQISSVLSRRLAQKIAVFLNDEYGLSLQLGAEGELPVAEYELLVGDIARSELAVSPYEFAVRVRGKVIEINASGALAYEQAYAYLTSVVFGKEPVELLDGFCYRCDVRSVIEDSRKYAYERLGEIRIMSANVCGSYGNRESRYAAQNAYRAERTAYFAETVKQYAPDFIGAQECGPAWRVYPWMVNRILPTLGYEEAFTSDDNFNPVFYRADKYELIDKSWHVYSGANNSNSKSYTWAVFKIKSTGALIGVFSTHFYYTGDEIGQKTRISNATELCEGVTEAARKYGCPFIGCGDFNCTVNQPPHEVLCLGGFKATYDGARVVSHTGTGQEGPVYDPDTGMLNSDTSRIYVGDNYLSHVIDRVYTYGAFDVGLVEVLTCESAVLSTDHLLVISDVTPLRAEERNSL